MNNNPRFAALLTCLIAILSAATARATPEAAANATNAGGDATNLVGDATKAAFLYRFAAYVEWPVARTGPAEFTIAVLADDKVAADLERLLAGRLIKGRPARVRRIRYLDEVGNAEILYVGIPRHKTVRRVIARMGVRPVLVVTDEASGLNDGSTVNFIMSEQHLRFEVSLAAAERRGLRISSQLLSLAARVEPGNGGQPQ